MATKRPQGLPERRTKPRRRSQRGASVHSAAEEPRQHDAGQPPAVASVAAVAEQPPQDAPVELFNSNLDSTLIGSPGAAHHFAQAWAAIPEERRPVLVYNSGRGLDDVRHSIVENNLPTPEFIIAGVGTTLLDVAEDRLLTEYTDQFTEGWDLELIERLVSDMPGIEKQGPENQNPIKSSWYLNNANRETIHLLWERLRSRGLQVNVLYTRFRFLDILPARTNKGLALKWLCERQGVPLDRVLVVGSSANDASCYYLPGVRGIVVENAKPELFEAIISAPVFRSDKVMSDGIVEGLVHYGVLSPEAAEPILQHHVVAAEDPKLKQLFDASHLKVLTEQEQALIHTGYEKAIDAIRRCVTPIGFSAASLPDNEITGTDENYHSVWSRDGCITVINTLMLSGDEEIRTAQRNTLMTLLDHISPNGQLPANVRIVNHQPDYSGVGGICAIDSNLWCIIAMYQYCRHTGERGLLRKYRGHLQRAMDWISAHDANNDGLIEVPEASDWTDLFGRSYNVLYDEVLWYRANVCYARILEMLGDEQRAADYHDWSQFIQGKCVRTFWPTSSAYQEATRSFADLQYSLGDARYLLAEVTPFSFNWRCDTYGNILAFLMGLIDADKARVAFAYMWGCGVNEPFPVANLYPVVQSGDPDWKSYYAVNLLNLPHHYHNGGIWPFIGGMWVRFINRLGQHEVACHELLKLAKLCKLGTRDEWEFNEWAHGQTGRPLGKRYQAWSAASYIRACHDLQLVESRSGEDA